MKKEHVSVARKLLGWTKIELAQRARVDRRTISNIEDQRHTPSPHTLSALRRAFETAGVEFQDGEWPRLRADDYETQVRK
jgi:transcriptional regulator with XRE-family HTH domain